MWRPLLAGGEVLSVGEYDRIPIPKDEKATGRYFFLPTGWWGVAPIYWRWSPQHPGMIDVSSAASGPYGGVTERAVELPGWLRTNKEFDEWRDRSKPEPSTERLYHIGRSFSFAQRAKNSYSDDGFRREAGFDADLAVSCFRRAGEQGSRKALKALACMYRDGIGVAAHSGKAFRYFYRAALSMEPIHLRDLARCYRDGLWCDPDAEMADYLWKLVEMPMHSESLRRLDDTVS